MKFPRKSVSLFCLFLFGGLFAPSAAAKHGAHGFITDSVAVCSFGGLRTFSRPEVHDSLIATLKILKTNSKRVDFFMYATLQDETPKTQVCFDYPSVHAKKEEAEMILRGKVVPEVDYVDFKLVEASGDITEANVDALVSHREQCFAGGFWQDKKYFVRSLNQWDHCNKCLKLITQREEEANMKYESVVLLRPDITIPTVEWDLPGKLKSLAKYQKGYDTKMLHYADLFALFNRKIMDRYIALMETFKHCQPGEACCGAMQQSEHVTSWIQKGLEASRLCEGTEIVRNAPHKCR